MYFFDISGILSYGFDQKIPFFITVLNLFQTFPTFSNLGRYLAFFQSGQPIFLMNFEFILTKPKKCQK